MWESTQVDPTDPNTFSFLTQNAAEGINIGLELNLDAQLNEYLSIFTRVGLLKTEIKNWKSRPDLEGRAQAHAPEKSYAFGVNWLISEKASLTIDITGKSAFYYSDSHNNKSQSYALTNFSYDYAIDNWTYSLWARNIFDEYYSTRGFYFGNEAPNFEDTLYERHGDPRHVGLSVRYDFWIFSNPLAGINSSYFSHPLSFISSKTKYLMLASWNYQLYFIFFYNEVGRAIYGGISADFLCFYGFLWLVTMEQS